MNLTEPLPDLLQLPRERIPLLLWWKNAPSVLVDLRIASQIDIPPTLLDLLGIHEKMQHFVGQSLLRDFQQQIFVQTLIKNFQIFQVELLQTQGQSLLQHVQKLTELESTLKQVFRYSLKNNQIFP